MRASRARPTSSTSSAKPADAPAGRARRDGGGCAAIWFQYGVINEEAIRLADEAGLDVVVDRCIKVESARFDGGLADGGFDSGLIGAHGSPPVARPRRDRAAARPCDGSADDAASGTRHFARAKMTLVGVAPAIRPPLLNAPQRHPVRPSLALGDLMRAF